MRMDLPLSPLAALVATALLLLCATPLHASQPQVGGGNCLYVTRQKYSQVLIYTDFSTDEHNHFEPIEALSTNALPTGLAFNRNLLYVGSYGNIRGADKTPPNIQIFDVGREEKLVGDLSSIPELATCFPEALLYHLGYLYVTCGVPGKGILKIDPEKKFVKAVLAKEIPLSWGLAIKDNHLYISSHCHDHAEGKEASTTPFCTREEHDKIFRIDLTNEKLTAEPFASYDGEEAAGLADLAFGPEGDLLAISYHRQTLLHWNSNGEFVKEIKVSGLEFPVGITFRGKLAYYTSPGRGEISQYDLEKNRQDLYAHPGPLLNSGLSYLVWTRCPLRKKDEL